MTRKFENVKIGQTVTFTENGFVESGIVSSVSDNKFTLTALRCFNKDGVKSFYNATFNFLKTGTKAHRNYVYGNAIDVSCTLC